MRGAAVPTPRPTPDHPPLPARLVPWVTQVPENQPSERPIDGRRTGPTLVDPLRRAPTRKPLTTNKTNKPPLTCTSEPPNDVRDRVRAAPAPLTTNPIGLPSIPPNKVPAAKLEVAPGPAGNGDPNLGEAPANAKHYAADRSPRAKPPSVAFLFLRMAFPPTPFPSALAPKTTTRRGVERDPTTESLTKASAGLKTSGGWRSLARPAQTKGG